MQIVMKGVRIGMSLINPFRLLILIGMMSSVPLPGLVYAWGAAGHQTVGAIADQLLAGSHAEQQVRKLLHTGETLEKVSIWADCAKGYCHAPLSEEMQTFVKENPHRHEYHYTDIPFQKMEYETGAIGTDRNDVVQILRQCINVLRGEDTPPTNPHHFTPRIALLLLAHFVGDVHQPLHVGNAYVNKDDHMTVSRSQKQLDSQEIHSTRGGNYLLMNKSQSLHGWWDTAVVERVMHHAHATTPQELATDLLQAYPDDETGSAYVTDWPIRWAHDALRYAKSAHAHLEVGPRAAAQDTKTRAQHFVWSLTVPATYGEDMKIIGERALVRAAVILQEPTDGGGHNYGL